MPDKNAQFSSSSEFLDSSFPSSHQQQQQHHERHTQKRPAAAYGSGQSYSSHHSAAAGMEPSSKDAPCSKPKQTKSRNGCVTCKLKRLKCDEKKPGCDQCSKRNVTCGGYKKDFKWRPFEEQNVAQVVKPATSAAISKSQKARTSAPAAALQSAVSRSLGDSQASGQTPASSMRNTSEETGVIQFVDDNLARKSPPSSEVKPKGPYIPPKPKVPNKKKETSPTTENSTLSEPSRNLGTITGIPPVLKPENQATSAGYSHASLDETLLFSSDSFIPDSASVIGGITTFPAGHLLLGSTENATAQVSWTQSDTLPQPFTGPPNPQFWSLHGQTFEDSSTGAELYEPDGDGVEALASLTHSISQTSEDSFVGSVYQSGPEDDTEEILRSQDDLGYGHTPFHNPSYYLAHGFDADLWSNPFQTIYQQPRLNETSVEMVVAKFDRRTCGIMSVKDGPSENPWRTMVLPLMNNNKMMFHSVMAMGCLHSCKQEPLLFMSGNDHFKEAFRQLQLVGKNSTPDNLDMVLAGMLALSFAESWGWTSSLGINCIHQSRYLMYGAINELRFAPRDSQHFERVKFLCRTWVYLDVIARLTSFNDDESCDFEEIIAMTEDPVAKLDPLMGCASTLFPIIGRTANLIRRACRAQTNVEEIVAEGMNLKMELEAWLPPHIEEIPEDETMHTVYSLHTAEAYRWATLLYLHQAIPDIPSVSSADLAHRAMTNIVKVPLSSRCVIVQIYPLLAAGCEAQTAEARALVEQRWASMQERMAIGNVDRCGEVAREVWNRRDEFVRKNPTVTSKPPVASALSVFDLGVGLNRPNWGEPSMVGGQPNLMEIPHRPKTQPSPHVLIASETNGQVETLLEEYTVRGRLHWAGVMRDWNWELFLG